jgi:hypothetical protein
MPNAKEIQATFLAVVTFLVRPSIFLVVGLAVGYAIGFSDAFRESDTLGNKVARAVYKVHPAALSEGVRQRASIIRDTVHAKTGVIEPPAADVPPPETPPY